MYRVKGADQKEYGPISAEQVGQWIQENRLNRFSLVERDGEPGWKPLEQFPEFAGALSRPTAVEPNPREGRESALAAVKLPAIAMIVWGWIFVVMSLWGIGGRIFGDSAAQRAEFTKQMQAFPDGPIKDSMMNVIELMIRYGVLIHGLTLAMGVIIALGATRMLRLKNLPLAWTAAVLVIQPCINPCCCIPLAFGIWAAVVLARAEVKYHFE